MNGSFLCCHLIEEQIKIGGNLIPWINRYAFEKELLKRKINAYLSSPDNKICFFDRGIPEAIAFFRLEDKSIPNEFFGAAEKYKDNEKIFVLPPWKDIYKNRPLRPQTWNEALRLHELIVEAYTELKYKIIKVPKKTVEERTKFMEEKHGQPTSI